MSNSCNHEDSRFSRRQFLGVLSALAAALAFGVDLDKDQSDMRTYLDRLFPSGSTAAAELGRRYLEIFPDESSISRLAGTLFGTRDVSSLGPPTRFTACLKQRRQQDFVRGDLVEIEGWFLARTEARLCALVVLCSSS